MHLTPVIDGGPQTAVVISKTQPGFEPCTSWMVCSCFIYTPISYSSKANLLYIWVKPYGSLHHPIKYRRTLYLQFMRDTFALNRGNHGHSKWRERQNATLPDLWLRQRVQASLPNKRRFSSQMFLVRCTPSPCFTP